MSKYTNLSNATGTANYVSGSYTNDTTGLYGSGDMQPSSLNRPGQVSSPSPAPARGVRLRATPARGALAYVDRDNRILLGVSVMQAVEALGHNLMLDEKSIDQVIELGNRAKNGVKSRFTHPGLSADGTGKFLGRFRNFYKGFRTDGTPLARADLHLSEIASKAPDGDLAGYVMGLAEEDPEAFGTSAVLWQEAVWVLDDGREVSADEPKPENSLYEYPVARVVDLAAVDVVDEPAANRDGMFSAFSGTPNEWSAAIFDQIDDALTHYGISPARAYEMAMKYFEARGVEGRAYALPHTADVSGVRRLAQKGLFSKETTMEEERLNDETFDEQPDAERAAPEPQRGQALLNQIVDAVSARVQTKLDEADEATGLVLGQIATSLESIQDQLEELSRRQDATEIALATLQGEPVVRRAATATGVNAVAQRLSAAIPANLPTPAPQTKPFETHRDNRRGGRELPSLEAMPADPLQAALEWGRMREEA